MEQNWLKAILLGIIRGISEILPISGSGHQAIFQQILGMQGYQEKAMLFEAMLRLGLFLGTVHFFRRELRSVFGTLRQKRRATQRGEIRLTGRLVFLIVVSALPMLLAVPFYEKAQTLYANLLFTAVSLAVSGILLFVCDHLPHGNKDGKNMTVSDAVFMGFGQAFSVLPGVSRSGLALSAGWLKGVDGAFAMEFTYLMWLPVLLVQVIAQLVRGVLAVSGGTETVSGLLFAQYLAGTAAASVLSYLSLRFMRFLTRKKNLGNFACYCWSAAMVAFILFLTC